MKVSSVAQPNTIVPASPPLTPLVVLPVEVLINIFYTARKTYPSSEETSSKRFEFPFLLSRVCRHWRITFANEPHLWNYIHLDDRALRDTQTEPHAMDPYQQAIERSGSAGLDVGIYMKSFNPVLSQPDRRLIQLIQSHAQRWQYLVLSSANSNVMDDMHAFFPRQLPRLRHLEYRATRERGWVILTRHLECPQLEELYLSRVTIPPGILDLCVFPLAKSLTCPISMTAFEGFTSAFPSSTRVHFNSCTYGSSGVQHVPPTVLALSIGVTSLNIRTFLTTITAPEVRVLAIGCGPQFSRKGPMGPVRVPWGHGIPKLNTIILHLQSESVWGALTDLVDHLTHIRRWILRQDLTNPPRNFAMEKLAGHITARVLGGATITIERPNPPMLKLHLRGRIALIRIYREDFPDLDAETTTGIPCLQEATNVEFKEKPTDVLEAALKECNCAD